MKKRIAAVLVLLFSLILALGVLTACTNFGERTYKISFYDDDVCVKTVTTSGNTTLELPEGEEKEGLIFEGWFFDRGSWTRELTPDTYRETPLTMDVNVYAHYTPNTPPVEGQEYTVTFYNGSVIYATQTGKEGTAITFPTAPEKPGYTFEGWFFGQNGQGGELTTGARFTQNVSVYAHFTQNATPPVEGQEYAVTFYNGNAVYATRTGKEGTAITFPTAPEKPGYTFEGWFFGQNGQGDELTTGARFTQNVSVYAYFTQNATPPAVQEYTVTFYNGNAVYATRTGKEGTAITFPEAPEKPGYTFEGWFFGQNGQGGELTTGARFTQNVSVYAYFKAKPVSPPSADQHSITFYNGDEVWATIWSAGYEMIQPPKAPEKPGYTFVNWCFSRDGREPFRADLYLNTALTGNVELYAFFREGEAGARHTITFYREGAVYLTQEVLEGEPFSLPPVPELPGHIFVGWFFGENGQGGQLTTNSPIASDVSVYAFYTDSENPTPPPSGEKYAVTLKPNNGGLAEVDGVKYSVITTNYLREAPKATKTGYRLAGWYTTSDFKGDPVSFPYVVTHAQTLYAKWELITYTVSFDMHGAAERPAIGDISTLEEPVPPVWSGHEFVGWYLDAAFKRPVTFPYKLTASITLHAKWLDVSQGVAYTVENGVITGYYGGSPKFEHLVIPSVVEGQQVVAIASEVFRDATFIRTLVLPEGLTFLGTAAFEGCSNLTQVTFPKTLTWIDLSVFEGTGLINVTLPASVQNVGMQAFANCPSLVSVDMSETAVTIVRQNLFMNDTALTTVRLPRNVVELVGGVFAGCKQLSTVDMPDSAVAISSSLFDGTALYRDQGNWENGVFYVDGYLVKSIYAQFVGTSYAVRPGTICIADSAFYSHAGYPVSITLPAGLLRIGENAFGYCENLSSINIPDSVREIGARAFNKTKVGEVVGGARYVDRWLIEFVGSPTSLTVREGTVGIANGEVGGFGKVPDLTELHLPDSLKYIGAGAFYRSKLTSLTLPKGLVSIGSQAFQDNFLLTSVDASKCTGLEELGERVFTNTKLKSFYLPASVQRLGNYVFQFAAEDFVVHCGAGKAAAGWAESWNCSALEGKFYTVVWNSRP